MSDDEDLIGFAPVDFFFSKEVDCYQIADDKKLTGTSGPTLAKLTTKYLLPSVGEVFGEDSFAKVFMGWQPAGLSFQIQVKQDQALVVLYPDFRQGDSIELFIDTRAITSAKTTHRFCHQFYFLPELFEGRQAGECTRFRTEDSHPLCEEGQLSVEIEKQAKGYTATIFIPKECLVGYDPQKGSYLGFTYRINSSQGQVQHFAMTSDDARLDTMPGLWAHLRLV